MWLNHPGFKDLVQKCWNNNFDFAGQFEFLTEIRKWYKQVFGIILKRKQMLMNLLSKLEEEGEHNLSQETLNSVNVVKKELNTVLMNEELL